MKHVLIALSSDMSGISHLPRILARHGIRTSVLAAPGFLLSLSNYVEHLPCRPGVGHTAAALAQHLDSERRYDMIILADDALLEHVTAHPVPLPQQVFPCRTDVDLHWSKEAFISLCRREGLPIPRTVVGATQSQAENAANDIGYPLVFKESTGTSGAQVFRLESLQELENHLSSRTETRPWLIQELVAGDICTADALFDNGRTVTWATSLVERTWGGPFSSSTARRLEVISEAEPLIERLGTSTGVHGFCGIDFIRTADGELKLLEMNCRPTIGHSVSTAAGVDFGAALAAMLDQRPLLQRQHSTTCVIPYFPDDLGRCIGHRDLLGTFDWLRLSRLRLLPWDEPRIFCKGLTYLGGRIVSGVWRRLKRSRENTSQTNTEFCMTK